MKFSLKQNSGFSLIEILVSLVVLSIGLMGLAGLQIAGLKGTNDAHYRTQASLLMMDLADRMRANQVGVAEGKYRTSSTINCANPPARQCDSESCEGDKLALFDRYTITCGIKKLLPQSQLEIDCDVSDKDRDSCEVHEQETDECQASDLGSDTQLNKTHIIRICWKEAKTSKEDVSDSEFKERSIKLDIIP